jgi:hypothetical protein
MTIATTKPCMYYDSTYPFAGFKKPTAVNTDLVREKQYTYSGMTVSHGEKIEEISEYVPKKYMWTSFVDFFKQRQKFQRYPFLHTPNI